MSIESLRKAVADTPYALTMSEVQDELTRTKAYLRSSEIREHAANVKIRELEAELKYLKNQLAGLTGPDGYKQCYSPTTDPNPEWSEVEPLPQNRVDKKNEV